MSSTPIAHEGPIVPTTYPVVVDPAGMFVDSYNRMGVVLNNMKSMPRMQWFEQLGGAWSGCDNIWWHRKDLTRILAQASEEELAAMMTEEERQRLAELPDTITVFRGCYARNRVGLSWTLDELVARRIVTLNRYRQPGEPIMRIARTSKRRAVLKLDREESEIITVRVHGVREVVLPRA